MSDAPLSEADALDLLRTLSNAGRWGPDDERGTLNLVDAAAVRRGTAEVRDGAVVSLARELHDGVPGFQHLMLYDAHAPRASQDATLIRSHGFEVTHVDALAHGFFEGSVYNGRRAADVVRPDGLAFGSIAALADGLVTRGVLLDVPRTQGREHLAAGDGIGAAELRAAEAAAGVTVMPGDAVFLRSGLDLRVARTGADLYGEPREGLLADALTWLRERDVAALCADCIERLPSGYERLPMPLHQIGLAAMGLVMVDGCDLERLADACRHRERSTFLLTAAPLPIRGGTGSPVNPLAVF